MIEFRVEDRALRAALGVAAREYPAIAVDAMSRAMLGLRKEFLADLRPRMPRMTSNRAQYQLWRVKAWRSQSNNVIGKFMPAPGLQASMSMLEYGGTVRPKTRQAMVIPARGAQTEDGRVRKAYRKGPKAWLSGAKTRKVALARKGDKTFVFQAGKAGVRTGKLLWVLVKSAVIRPVLGMHSFWGRTNVRAAFMERIRKVLVRDLFPKRRAA